MEQFVTMDDLSCVNVAVIARVGEGGRCYDADGKFLGTCLARVDRLCDDSTVIPAAVGYSRVVWYPPKHGRPAETMVLPIVAWRVSYAAADVEPLVPGDNIDLVLDRDTGARVGVVLPDGRVTSDDCGVVDDTEAFVAECLADFTASEARCTALSAAN